MASPQSLSEADRRLVARWAADCAEHVLGIFESAMPGDDRLRALIERARAYARGDTDTAGEIRRRFAGGVPAEAVTDPAALAAARAAGQAASQAAAMCHMGAHALGAAAYAAEAAGLARSPRTHGIHGEIDWQLRRMSEPVRDALRGLPLVGTDRSGPLGPGLLTAEPRGSIISRIQAALAESITGLDRFAD